MSEKGLVRASIQASNIEILCFLHYTQYLVKTEGTQKVCEVRPLREPLSEIYTKKYDFLYHDLPDLLHASQEMSGGKSRLLLVEK